MTESALVDAQRPRHPQSLDALVTRAQTRFFSYMSAAILLAVLVGFSPTYYLRGAFFETPAIEPRVWLHGAALTAWFVAFWLQATLVARQRLDWHRRVGWVVAAIAFAAVATSLYVTWASAEAGRLAARTAWSNFANAIAFATFVVVAITRRRHGATHKRLLLLASIAFLQPALARVAAWSSFADLGVRPLTGGLVGSLLFLAPLVVHDMVTRGRLHSATLVGGAALIALRVTAVFLVAPSGWGQAVWFGPAKIVQ